MISSLGFSVVVYKIISQKTQNLHLSSFLFEVLFLMNQTNHCIDHLVKIDHNVEFDLIEFLTLHHSLILLLSDYRGVSFLHVVS